VVIRPPYRFPPRKRGRGRGRAGRGSKSTVPDKGAVGSAGSNNQVASKDITDVADGEQQSDNTNQAGDNFFRDGEPLPDDVTDEISYIFEDSSSISDNASGISYDKSYSSC